MKKYQIVEISGNLNHAGTKATADIALIAEKMGFQPLSIKIDTSETNAVGKLKKQLGYYTDWKHALNTIENNSVVILQHPFHHKQLTREKVLYQLKKKGISFISFVHDVEELRVYRYNEYYHHEYETMLHLADILIVHNGVMKQWFIEKGIPEDKLISLGVFDYLQKYESVTPLFDRSITVAGNLDIEKSGYIGELGKLKNIRIHLYGPNFSENLKSNSNIEYHGSFPSDEIPRQLNKGFGLVWDGNSVYGCTGASGQYLKYNNPHKLSLYLSSGLPVVIWKDAAEAEYVRSHHLGICVDNLDELNSIFAKMTEDDYKVFLDNVSRVRKEFCSGVNTEKALNSALVRLNELMITD